LKELGIAEKQFSDACNNNSSGLEKFEVLYFFFSFCYFQSEIWKW